MLLSITREAIQQACLSAVIKMFLGPSSTELGFVQRPAPSSMLYENDLSEPTKYAKILLGLPITKLISLVLYNSQFLSHITNLQTFWRVCLHHFFHTVRLEEDMKKIANKEEISISMICYKRILQKIKYYKKDIV